MILKNKRKYTKEEKELLWERYREDPDDLVNFNMLLESYLPLVEVIASKSKAVLPPHIEIEDLVNDAFFGLVDAVQKFDASKGFKFETYASQRIRGDILDRLRDYDWVSRYSRFKFKQVAQAELSLQTELQREPKLQDIAEKLNWTLDEVVKVQSAYQASFSVNIDEYITDATHESFSLQELLADESEDDFATGMELNEMLSSLELALFKLNEQESIIVFLHHFEQLKFAKIAELLDISTAKIAQIYDQAILKMKNELEY